MSFIALFRPSPAMVVASIALVASLAGAAGRCHLRPATRHRLRPDQGIHGGRRRVLALVAGRAQFAAGGNVDVRCGRQFGNMGPANIWGINISAIRVASVASS